MKRDLLRSFWNCGDDAIIQFALLRAHLNAKEKAVINCVLDECLTQEETAEKLGYSTRRVQDIWYSASNKMLNIPWLVAYANVLQDK